MAWKNDQVSKVETEKILELARMALEYPGDFVEMGCYKGDTSLILAEVLKHTDKKLWLYDSFEGLPEKSEADASALGINFKKGELFTTKRELKERFLRANLKLPVIKKAWFNELIEVDLPEKIAFCFLDGDLYESIRDSLKLVKKKIVNGGILIIHDYKNPALPGVFRAVNECFDEQDLEIFESMAIIKY